MYYLFFLSTLNATKNTQIKCEDSMSTKSETWEFTSPNKNFTTFTITFLPAPEKVAVFIWSNTDNDRNGTWSQKKDITTAEVTYYTGVNYKVTGNLLTGIASYIYKPGEKDEHTYIADCALVKDYE